MLTERYADSVGAHLLGRDTWNPFPRLTERDAWMALPDSLKRAQVQRGEALLGYEWPALTATLTLEYVRNGNRSNYQDVRYARRHNLRDLVLAECIEGEGRFLDDIVNGVWATCEESYWGVPAHLRLQAAGWGLPDTAEPTVDLFVAETASLLAWVYYLIGSGFDAVSPLILPRLEREIRFRMLEPLLAREDFSWMGFDDTGRRVNNWNPWITSNWLTSVLLVEDDVALREAHVKKAMQTVDHFIDPYPRDGGCDEGPSYWNRAGGSLFDCLELLYGATDGHVDVYADPLVREIGRFIHRVQIADQYFINFADAPAIVSPFTPVVFNYGQRIDDAEMMALGAWAARRDDVLNQSFQHRESIGRYLRGLFSLDAVQAADARQPLPRDVWLPEIEVMVARDKAGSSEGLMLGAKGGNNNESHNHNDIGNFVVYIDGLPVLVDAGVETYTAKTFSGRRYEIWTMQSGYHTLLPTVDGVMQAPGADFKATAVSYQADDAQAGLSLDIAASYPAEAKIARWQRQLTLTRGEAVTVVDDYELGAAAEEISLSLVTPCAVELAAGQVNLSPASLPDGREAGAATFSYPADIFSVTTENVPITDSRLRPIWGESLTRVVLTAKNPATSGTWEFSVRR